MVLLGVAAAFLIGVFLGTLLFRPAYEPLYKAACLLLLAALSTTGLVNQFM